MEKIEWAVFVKEDAEWKQYSTWEGLEFAKNDFYGAKKRGYIEIQLKRKVITENITMDYRERNGHFTDGICTNIEDIKCR
jgi:hypothetical protein